MNTFIRQMAVKRQYVKTDRQTQTEKQ